MNKNLTADHFSRGDARENKVILCGRLGNPTYSKAFGTTERTGHEPQEGGACASVGTSDGPNPEASDDDDDGGGDSDPDRPRRARSQKSPPSFPPALLGLAPLSHYVDFGRSRIYQLISAGQFPAPIKVGKSSRWVRAEIDAWLSRQIASRQSNPSAG